MTLYTCELCDEQTKNVAFCTACNFNLCDPCWLRQPPHKKGLLGPGGLPHEKADPQIVQELTECMAEPTEEEECRHHQEDEETTWFGLERDAGGEPILAEYRRYAAVMMQTSELKAGTRYPSLVSFVGQTGAGKSSLINLLIDLKADAKMADDDPAKMAPIIGRSSSAVPTSADVHLYLSPETRFSKRPILYADCEGFEGGERSPVAINSIMADQSGRSGSDKHSRRPHVVRKFSQGTKRLLKWASHDSHSYEETSKRGYAVSEMYPRIFYAFSDVIVFVLDNPKTLEVVVERLLEWADANYSRSINQPTKPHAIIALNKSNPKTPEDQWNTMNATANLLNTTSAKIDENQTFVKYAKMWKKVSLSRIDSMQDLLRCYYSTVHVVRLPEKSRYQLLNQQRQLLHQVIGDCCAISFKDKQERELLTDVDDFGLYLSLAFDHFSETLDEPFDFVEASLKRNPLPTSFADNLLVFARRMGLHKGCSGRILELFQYMTPFIASCILLESVRRQRIGRPEDWFGDLEEDDASSGEGHRRRRASTLPKKPKPDTYRDMCRTAIFHYFGTDVPCGFAINDPFALKKRPCDIRSSRHGTTHRAAAKFRTIDAPGEFQMDFDKEQLWMWEQDVLAQLIFMHDKLVCQNTSDYRKAVICAHAELLPEFYQAESLNKSKAIEFQLNSICVSCLCNPPQHHLECGHILCTECAKDFGSVNGRTISLQSCPLRDNYSGKSPGSLQTTIKLAPPFSGLRVLVLDGGGARGIVELSVLQAVEDCIGVPLQKFFDLVVGTSTGGIVALSFGHQMWPVDQCIQKFKRLIVPAFTKRKGQDVHVVRRVQLFVKHSKYETTPLELTLRQTFGERPLFTKQSHRSRIKTAVVAVSSSGSMAWVLSNYNTHNIRNRGPQYQRYRPGRPMDEICAWEAARSTFASPGFFKPFSPDRPGSKLEEWIDGAVLHNNPVEIAIEEARRVAEVEQLNSEPDIVLSVGTGLSNKVRNLGDIPSHQSHRGPPKAKTTGWIRSLFTMVSYQVKLNTDADRRWASVLHSEGHISKHLHRINPDLGMAPPEFDDVDCVNDLSRLVPNILSSDPTLKFRIEEVSCALVASSFYFEREGDPINKSSTSTEVHGRIRCRLDDEQKLLNGDSDCSTDPRITPESADTIDNYNPDDIVQLGRFILRSFRPEFIIYNDAKNMEDIFISVPTDEMKSTKTFPVQSVTIPISADDVITTIALRLPGICGSRAEFPISGFPRRLMKMDFSPSFKAGVPTNGVASVDLKDIHAKLDAVELAG